MKRVFCIKKDKEPPPSIGDASDRISKRGDSVEEKIKKLDAELGRYKEQIKKTRPGPALEAVKARANRVLEQKRVAPGGVFQGRTDGAVFLAYLEPVAYLLRDVRSEFCKQRIKRNDENYEDVLQDEMMDLLDVRSEIQESLGRSYNVPEDLDEDKLMGELDALESDMGFEGEADGVPSYLQPDRKSDYDSELNLPSAPTGRANPLVIYKEIQCYVCNTFGHLCCSKSINASPREISCYKCGLLGHTGLACTRPHGENAEPGTPSVCFRCGEGGHFARECTNSAKASARPRVESSETGPPSLCYKCGEGGHFARECENSKLGKRSHEYSTPTRSSKGNKSYGGYKSEPRDIGKAHKKKKTHYEDSAMTTPRSFKPRGGWITEDPGDYDYRNHKENTWRTPESNRNGRRYSAYNGGGGQYSGGGPNAGSQFSGWSNYSKGSTTQQSGRSYNYGASVPRYGTSSSDGRGRNNDWW